MFQPLEARRCLAATATLTERTLTVVGTNESERIDVAYSLLPVTALSATANRFIPLVAVRVDGELLGRFKLNAVKKIHVLANGGNDRVTAPSSTVISSPRDATGLSDGVAFAGVIAKPMLIEGGSGRDRLVGGVGDDTLLGGRGNDNLYDPYGRNRLDGGRGDDFINGVDKETAGRFSTLNAFSTLSAYDAGGDRLSAIDYGPSPDTLVGGAGNDSYSKDADDVVIDLDSNANPIAAIRDGTTLFLTYSSGLSLGLRL